MELPDEISASCEADIYRPLLALIRAKKSGLSVPPYIPKWDLMPLAKLCKLALLWKEAGFEKEAGELAYWLFKVEPFPSLWCPEKEFHEEMAKKLFLKIRSIEQVSCEKPDIDLTFIETEALAAALTLDGNGTSLGVIRADGFEIRALGPQNETLCFGIQGKGMAGWTRTAAYPEVWLEMKNEVKEESLRLDVRFVGIEPERPLFFAFYVKAGSCQIESSILKPKSLHRFQGEVRGASFDNRCQIEASHPHKIQVIPLAGERYFWDTDFLLSFEIPSFAPQVSFLISITQ